MPTRTSNRSLVRTAAALVVAVTACSDMPTAPGDAEVFADNFAQSSGPLPAAVRHRPVGVTEGPDGSLYISDDRGGRIWRVIYTGR